MTTARSWPGVGDRYPDPNTPENTDGTVSSPKPPGEQPPPGTPRDGAERSGTGGGGWMNPTGRFVPGHGFLKASRGGRKSRKGTWRSR